CDKVSHSSKPRIDPAFIELGGKRHYTGRGYTRWDKWFIKSFTEPTLREWFPKRFRRKCFRGQPMESEMATFRNLLCYLGIGHPYQAYLLSVLRTSPLSKEANRFRLAVVAVKRKFLDRS
ncbi:hypothetical protein AVEN_136698-1, partial [Araneus ventricosus]